MTSALLLGGAILRLDFPLPVNLLFTVSCVFCELNLLFDIEIISDGHGYCQAGEREGALKVPQKNILYTVKYRCLVFWLVIMSYFLTRGKRQFPYL